MSKPPHNCDDGNNANQDRDDTIHVRDSLLEGFCKANIIPSLVAMATSLDNDAVYFSLCIMDAIHRRVFDRLDDNGLIRTAFDEADCLNVLESICESASASVKYGTGRDWDSDNTNTIAEMAANLIDDFYDEAFVEDDGVTNKASTSPFGMNAKNKWGFQETM